MRAPCTVLAVFFFLDFVELFFDRFFDRLQREHVYGKCVCVLKH